MSQYRRSRVTPNDRLYTIDEIAEIVAPIADEMGVDALYLFGSYARGEATAESDIDIVVESGEIDSYFGLGRLYMRLNEALQKDIDLIPSDAGAGFLDSIGEDLVPIYRRKDGT